MPSWPFKWLIRVSKLEVGSKKESHKSSHISGTPPAIIALLKCQSHKYSGLTALTTANSADISSFWKIARSGELALREIRLIGLHLYFSAVQKASQVRKATDLLVLASTYGRLLLSTVKLRDRRMSSLVARLPYMEPFYLAFMVKTAGLEFRSELHAVLATARPALRRLQHKSHLFCLQSHTLAQVV